MMVVSTILTVSLLVYYLVILPVTCTFVFGTRNIVTRSINLVLDIVAGARNYLRRRREARKLASGTHIDINDGTETTYTDLYDSHVADIPYEFMV